jgi:hypothetical protein
LLLKLEKEGIYNIIYFYLRNQTFA